ncbi:rRNA maturation RNase YbeY [Ammoniphilus sp. CFH 90114]|uniref:rRNA maturation RNase YbeY n=1 Tax=Ammoniphilus sp. CFH 90114 TaxID=2493665 RepID=UPI00100F5D68|nr:rRNA maturation RNase YbeY [Ammoniphilus sp. CFH 90114]RXT14837.1 rRNA maturation RNase YbeY [Ammoniphilus sp. CFH 90114]
MRLNVEFINEQNEPLAQELLDMLVSLLEKAAEVEAIQDKELAITFVDNAQIQELNKQFREKDKPTDVLSFPLEEEDALGDIIISIPKVREQAEDYNHSFERELGFLTVHGFLHLNGYDHETEEEEKEMFERQERILKEFGLTR